MSVHQRAVRRDRPKLEIQPATFVLTQQELLEQERLPRQRRRLVARQQVDELVAQREQAGRLQPHHGNPRLHIGPQRVERAPHLDRSEEHTSELQSLMRISYAVFCLKKKKTRK